MTRVSELVKDIAEKRTQVSSSLSDEEKVMRAMLNDREYEVGVYGKEGQIDTYNPAKDARSMAGSIIASTTKIPKEEAIALADKHEFSKGEAKTMINVGKEFVNTYLQTGRKLPLGGRETSDVSLIGKHVEPTTRTYPKHVGIDENGKKIVETATVQVNAHDTIRVSGSCPAWLK